MAPPAPTPTLIVVSGPAGSGKTTLAHRLAAVVGCPALCRDELKEGMVHTVGAGFRPSTSDPLTMRTYDLFFDLIGAMLTAGVSLVAEAAFQDRVWRQGLARLPEHRLRVVRCQVDDETAAARVRRRQAELATRAAHDDAGSVVVPSAFDPIALEVPTLDVDTSTGYRPTIEEIAAFVT